MPLTNTGPRLEKLAIVPVELTAPTAKAPTSRLGGAVIVAQLGPLLPAETDMKIPALSTCSTAACRLPAVQVSVGGQSYELSITSGRLAGSGLLPARSVGATNHCRHSM